MAMCLRFVPKCVTNRSMADDPEITHLQQQVDALSAENAALRDGGFRGSKAEALMALECDRIPNALKTPRAIALQRNNDDSDDYRSDPVGGGRGYRRHQRLS